MDLKQRCTIVDVEIILVTEKKSNLMSSGSGSQIIMAPGQNLGVNGETENSAGMVQASFIIYSQVQFQ